MKPDNCRRGQEHHKAVLTDQEVEQVREIYAEGWHSYKQLAIKFDVSKGHIRDIVKERRRIYG